MTKTKDLEIKQISIKDLKPSEYNPRQASEKEVGDLTESIKKFGLVDPIIVNFAKNRKNIVIGGHFRLRIAKDLGYSQIPVVYVNIPDIKKEKELNLRLNKNLGMWDYDLLANFDEELLKKVGFGNDELDNIFQLNDDEKANEIPIGGSGTTLIACQRTNRKCFSMEIDPQYCQVIIDRYEQYTGKKAKKL